MNGGNKDADDGEVIGREKAREMPKLSSSSPGDKLKSPIGQPENGMRIPRANRIATYFNTQKKKVSI